MDARIQQLFMPWQWNRWTWAAAFIPAAITLYLLSEAPILRFRRGSMFMTRPVASPFVPIWGPTVYDADETVFQPAHLAFDNTLLKYPLGYWAKLWGVEDEVQLFSAARTGGLYTTMEWDRNESE
jgi:hypothetical protein